MFIARGGTIRTASIYNNRFLFTGREWLKDLKLYDYRNRMYQPELGRFLQPDPKQFGAGDYNLYRYCHNDPINKSDPTGLETLTRPETDELVADRVGAIGARIYKEADYMVSTGLDNIRNDAVGTALDVAALGKFSQLKSGIAAANRPGPNPVKEAAKAFQSVSRRTKQSHDTRRARGRRQNCWGRCGTGWPNG